MPESKTPFRLEVERLLQAHPSGLSISQISERLNEDKEAVKAMVNRLRRVNLVRPLHPQKTGTAYVWIQVPEISRPAPVNSPEPYLCPELRPFSGRPGCDQHMQYGSLQPDGSVAPYKRPSIQL